MTGALAQRRHIRMWGTVRRAGVLACSLWLASGCERVTIGQAIVMHNEAHRDALAEFVIADYHKPQLDDVSGHAGALAPLLVQQVEPYLPDGGPAAPVFGVVYEAEGGRLEVDGSQPGLYYAEVDAEINPGDDVGSIVTYAWWRRGESDAGVSWQALRVLLDGDGYPLVWELLDQRDPERHHLFVSTMVEERAVAEYGEPVEGRRYAVERTVGRSPRTVVARVIESGPVPMGPYVYQGAGDGRLMGVVCRCMPAQVGSFASEQWYDLLPLDELPPRARDDWDSMIERSVLMQIDRFLRWPTGLLDA